MKFKITVTLKAGILDNAGKAVTRALNTMGYDEVNDVRIGKEYYLTCKKKDIAKIAKSVTNEVMENYIIEKL
jgi:phosphoribosylformylglycinamidine synthase PurS subunit